MKQRCLNRWYRIFSVLVTIIFLSNIICPPGITHAQIINTLNLPIPGTMVNPSPAFTPVLLKGMTIHPEDPLKFDFILDSGNTDFDVRNGRDRSLQEESQRLIKYFLASLTVPKDDLWVNLSPYEGDRIIPEEMGKTDLGRDLLALDYILKQLTASLMYPEDELGKAFWEKVYQRAEEEFGTTEIPMNTFNKVWILPEKATVYEHEQTVYVVESRLKVMLDSDYVALENSSVGAIPRNRPNDMGENMVSPIQEAQELGENIIREIILPEIEKEVNEGQNFAQLRQIYNSLILAKWYKETIQDSLLSQAYVDQNKVVGVENDDPLVNGQIYVRYIKAFKKGVFNYIKEDYDRLSGEMIPRKYFSGGIPLAKTLEVGRAENGSKIANSVIGQEFQVVVQMDPQGVGQAASPISFDDVSNVFRSLKGALEEGGQVLSVKEGSLIDLSFLNPIVTYVSTYPWTAAGITLGLAAYIAYILDFEKKLAGVLKKRSENFTLKDIQGTQAEIGLKNKIEKIIGLKGEQEEGVKGLEGMVKELLPEVLALAEKGYAFELEEVKGEEGHRLKIEKTIEFRISTDDGFSKDEVESLKRRKKINESNLGKSEILKSKIEQVLSEIEGAVFVSAKQYAFFDNDGHPEFSDNRSAVYSMTYFRKVRVPNLKVVQGEPLLNGNGAASSSVDVGGIDLNNIDVSRQGSGMNVRFDPETVDPVLNRNIKGFAPVIINITPIQNILPLLGLDPPKPDEGFELSVLK